MLQVRLYFFVLDNLYFMNDLWLILSLNMAASLEWNQNVIEHNLTSIQCQMYIISWEPEGINTVL